MTIRLTLTLHTNKNTFSARFDSDAPLPPNSSGTFIDLPLGDDITAEFLYQQGCTSLAITHREQQVGTATATISGPHVIWYIA